ncbi:MAG: glycosyltransferase family 4 protein, partial [bacterium]
LSPSYPPNREPCGVGDFTRMLVPELVRAGAEAAVFTGLDYRGPRESGGVSFLPIARDWTPRALVRLARAAREEKVHALLVQYAPDLYPPGGRWICLLPLVMKALSPGIPVVLSMHTLGVSTLGSMARAGLLINTAHAVLSTNEEVTHLIGRRLRPVLRKTWEVPIGANVEPAAADAAAREGPRRRVREEAGLAPEGIVLAHFGFYYPGKGVEQILEAAGRWREEGRDFRLFMIGGRRSGDGGFYPALQERARALGLGEEVVWTGFVDNARVSEILLAADLFLAPYEGGISIRRGSLMAALVHGLPVVSTPPRAPTKYFREGENFAAVPFGDAEALADRAGALMEDAEARARLRAGAEDLAARFRWPAIAEGTRAFLHSVLAGRPLRLKKTKGESLPLPAA